MSEVITVDRLINGNVGKFFDVPATNKYFGDISAAFDEYEKLANDYIDAIDEIATTDSWQGIDAEAAKTLLSETEVTLLKDIIQLHKDFDSFHAEILNIFKTTVDSAPDAYINYNDLVKIQNDFKSMWDEFTPEADEVERIILDCQRKYSHYGTISTPDLTPGKNAFKSFCGYDGDGISEDAIVGIINESKNKLINFDSQMQAKLKDKKFKSRIADLQERMCKNVMVAHPGYGLNKYVDNIEKFEEVYKQKRAEEALKKDASLWTVDDATYVAEWYENAVEQKDEKTIKRIYDYLVEEGKGKLKDGTKANVYYLDPNKTNNILSYMEVLGYKDTEAYNNLSEMSQADIICSYKGKGKKVRSSIEVEHSDMGMIVNWSAKGGELVGDSYQGVIFDTNGLSYKEKYDNTEKEKGIDTYRKRLKSLKDQSRKEELESVSKNPNLKRYGRYIQGLKTKKLYTDKMTYAYINGDAETRIAISYAQDNNIDSSLDLMTEKQKYIYNYLYYQDSINGTDTAEEYLDLILDSLYQKEADDYYYGTKGNYIHKDVRNNVQENQGTDGIKDSGALKTVYESCYEIERGVIGIQNVFGVNDDRDGVARKQTAEYIDENIMSNATASEARFYNGVKAATAIGAGVAVTLATAGAGAPEAIGMIGTATYYGLSSAGNDKAELERAGYTEQQAVTHSTFVGVKEAAKIAAMSKLGRVGATSPKSIPVGALETGATTFGIEFADNVVVNPTLDYVTLDDKEAYRDVDYGQAAKNATLAGVTNAAVYTTFGMLSKGKRNESSLNEVSVEEQNISTDIPHGESSTGKQEVSTKYLDDTEDFYNAIFDKQYEVTPEYDAFVREINEPRPQPKIVAKKNDFANEGFYKGEKAYDYFVEMYGKENVSWDTCDPVEAAQKWQGEYPYTGVDEYSPIRLNRGDVIYMGEPYPTGYSTTLEAISQTGNSARKIFEGLQVKPYYEDGMEFATYRAEMTPYRVNEPINVAEGITKANPQFGEGGLLQRFDPNFAYNKANGLLTPLEDRTIHLTDTQVTLDEYFDMMESIGKVEVLEPISESGLAGEVNDVQSGVTEKGLEFNKIGGREGGYGSLSNVEARKWYLEHEAKIPDMLDTNLSLEGQAKQAFDLRNKFRTEARELMSDRTLAESLYKTDPNWSWEMMVQKQIDKGLTGDDIYKEIIASAQRSRKAVNKSLGLE